MVFLPMPPGGFRIAKSLEGGIYPRSQHWDTSQVVGDRQTDVGAILFRTPPPIAFFEVSDELTLAPAPGRPVAICGYPKAKSKAVQIGSIVTDLGLPDFQGASVADASSFGAQPFQFAIDYPNMAESYCPEGTLVRWSGTTRRTAERLTNSSRTSFWVRQALLPITLLSTALCCALTPTR
jgi:hypothetical protein